MEEQKTKRLYIAYNKRSCVTGKALFDKMKESMGEDFSIRRTMRGSPKFNPDILLRFGNSSLEFDVVSDGRQGVAKY